jgi:hypothetical protein
VLNKKKTKKKMKFYIKQGSSEPILKARLIDDGKTDKSYFNEKLENSTITFDMFDVKNNEPVILNVPCFITNRKTKYNNITDELFIVFSFNEEHTSKKGVFEGVFTIQFFDDQYVNTSKLIVPIKEKLFIYIV